jgi:hypothetical protein
MRRFTPLDLWVKQIILTVFFGVDVPRFSISLPRTLRWGRGVALFGGGTRAIASGSFSFASNATGWFYVWAQESNATTAAIVVSATAPTLATQQLWWYVQLGSGSIRQIIPAKPGFGV